MKYVILGKNNRTIAEIKEDNFKELLKIYFNEHNDIDKAFEAVKEELFKKLLHT